MTTGWVSKRGGSQGRDFPQVGILPESIDGMKSHKEARGMLGEMCDGGKFPQSCHLMAGDSQGATQSSPRTIFEWIPTGPTPSPVYMNDIQIQVGGGMNLGDI